MMGYKIIDFSANFICKALFPSFLTHHEIDFDFLVVPTFFQACKHQTGPVTIGVCKVNAFPSDTPI